MAQIANGEAFIRSRITQLRQAAGVSEHKMSLDLGKSGNYIRAISSGTAMPSMREFFRICEYFNVTPVEFFSGMDTDSLDPATNIVNSLRNLSEEDLQKVQTFIGWIASK